MKGRSAVILASALAVWLLGLGCSNSSGSGTAKGAAGSGFAGGSAGSGSQCSGSDCSSGGAATAADGAAAARACRDYFTTVCARIRECGAPRFRPCESPIDACPDILFSDGSGWTVPQVAACTEEWKTHDCAALTTDQGPACSQLLGVRPVGGACVFDVQCQSGHCNGGVVPSYQASCGSCAELAPSHGACDEQHVCPSTELCEQGTCIDGPVAMGNSCVGTACPNGQTCNRGLCVPLVPLGGPCDYSSACVAGLACQIEIIPEPEPEPDQGTCRPLPAIGQPCLPTFGHSGLCVDGGTCSSRPTGMCVPLVEVGQSCGFTRCVPGAYCQVEGYASLPSHLCYARGNEGDACPHEGGDLGTAACADGLDCLCAAPDCLMGVCSQARAAGQSCNATTEQCKNGLLCTTGVCVDPNMSAGSVPAGADCRRTTAFGRESGGCMEGLDCLCTDPQCTQSLCASPRLAGETCDAQRQICRQGLTCAQGLCTELSSRDFESQSCSATAP